jgi:hypothetical protein
LRLRKQRSNLVAVVLGDGLGALRDGVLGQLTGEQEADGRLDFAGRDGLALVVAGEAAGLSGNALEDVLKKRKGSESVRGRVRRSTLLRFRALSRLP